MKQVYFEGGFSIRCEESKFPKVKAAISELRRFGTCSATGNDGTVLFTVGNGSINDSRSKEYDKYGIKGPRD